MLHLIPPEMSRLRAMFGLDAAPFRWFVADEQQNQRGEFSVGHWLRHATLELDAAHYPMQRRRTGLLRTQFTLMAASGAGLASAVQRVRGLMARETTVHIAGKAFALSGSDRQFTLLDVDMRIVGSIRIERGKWHVRQLQGRLYFDADAVSEAVQVFLFWLCINRDLSRSGGSD